MAAYDINRLCIRWMSLIVAWSFCIRISHLFDLKVCMHLNFNCILNRTYLTCNVRKHTVGHVHPEKIPIILCISRRLIRIFTVSTLEAKNARFLNADTEDSDQAARMCRLFWVFVVCTCKTVRLITLWLFLFSLQTTQMLWTVTIIVTFGSAAAFKYEMPYLI